MSETAESYGNTIFTFLRNCQTVFHSGYCILHTHQQCTKVPISPYPHWHLVFLFWKNYSHPNGCKVILIRIS